LDPQRPQCPCGFQFRWRGRLLDWETQPDTFYEGRYAGEIHFDKRRLERPGGRLLLHFLVWGYYEAILRSVPPGGRILDIGCAGGSKLLAEWGRVTGLDLSLHALEIAASKYAWGLRANACRVDFAPATFHAIVSCFFWEHIRPPDKDLLLEKFRRWLRPGGKVIFLFDVASCNPVFTWCRKDPDLFRQAFIEHDGHYGLESASAALPRFAEHGFSVRRWHAMCRSPVQDLSVLGWLEPYGRKYRCAKVISRAGTWIATHKVLNMLYTGSVQLFDDTFGRLLPLDWSRILLVVLEKRA
jgi:SAM-dependent methyltransferase